VTALWKYDGEQRGLAGAAVVKPTYTPFNQRFQLNFIIQIYQSTRLLPRTGFQVNSIFLLVLAE